MSSDLLHWQQHLTAHFQDLASQRNGTVGRTPIFVLEHGLETNELQALANGVRTHISNSAPSNDHSLPWLVYATELGYRYSGAEYWQTFESETPGWLTHGDRYWIRSAFRGFRAKFGGAEPTGPWADHFSIICWPITHAILPRDLQQQLAKLLFESRHDLSDKLFESPSKLGEFIAARCWNATSRFQNLAQSSQLVGQIAAALLLQGKFGTGGLILPATLRRIGEDLDRVQRTRIWLSGARKAAEKSFITHGLAPIHGPMWGDIPPTHPEDAWAQVVALGIEPRLILRPTSGFGESWEVRIEIPDLSHLLMRFPKTREILTGSRCVVAGATGQPLARGRFLHGAQQFVLTRWPRADEVLLRFEQTDPLLDFLLRTECLLRPGTSRLFRVASDGLAYELRGMRVRPGERYVLVSTSGALQANARARSVALNCEGAEGVIITLPETLDTGWEETLRALGLGQARAIEVWPAGLPALVWDGENIGEWFASEQPCLAMRADHEVNSLSISMGDGVEEALEISPIEPGEPVFVELPKLAVGLHTVRVVVRGGADSETEQLGILDVVIRIRERLPFIPNVNLHGPLLVQIDPSAPTLEQLWEGRVDFTIRGPTGRIVQCRAVLFENNEGSATYTKQLPPIPLPVTTEGWRAHFGKHFRGGRDTQDAYDTARICELEFSADELGAFKLRCEREFTPLRWAVRRHSHEYMLSLVDDSGETEVPKVVKLAFETPLVEEPLEFAREYKVPAAGGLYVACMGQLTAAVIVPPSGRGIDDLRCTPRVVVGERSVHCVIKLLTLAHLWGHARLPGDLFSTTRRRTVLHALAREVFRLIGGDKWSAAEAAVGSTGDKITDLQHAVSRHREESGFSEALAFEYTTLATAKRRESIDCLVSLGTKYRIWAAGDDPVWLAELALRLASDIAEVYSWAGRDLPRGLTRLLDLPTLARAARFLVIATDQYLQCRTESGELYAGWLWT